MEAGVHFEELAARARHWPRANELKMPSPGALKGPRIKLERRQEGIVNLA